MEDRFYEDLKRAENVETLIRQHLRDREYAIKSGQSTGKVRFKAKVHRKARDLLTFEKLIIIVERLSDQQPARKPGFRA